MNPTERTTSASSEVVVRLLVLGLLLLGLLATALLAGPAAAQDYPPEVTVGTPGATITIRGTDWGPGTQVEITYLSASGQNVTVAATVAEDGTFVADLALPQDATPGESTVTVQGTGSDGQPRQDDGRVLVQAGSDAGSDTDSGTVEVSGAAPDDPVPTENLSSTGLDLAIGLVALALLAAGGAALLTARRRRA